MAGGYLRVKVLREYLSDFGEWKQEYTLELTNIEVKTVFRAMVRKWFARVSCGYNDFVRALLSSDVKAMNIYMNNVALATFSYFDTGKDPSVEEPERFYHSFVLGLMVELADRYILTSNRESGFGRYDVMMEPMEDGMPAMILEFKVFHPAKERDLTDTVQSALRQIEEKQYDEELTARGISKDRIRHYGFAFEGKHVLIGEQINEMDEKRS